MTTLLSPGVNITEIDLTTIVPSVSTSTGAFAGLFRWGPIGERALIDTEDRLVLRFGKPTSYNAETFFTAANFLAYGDTLYVVRAGDTSGNVPYATFRATANSDPANLVSNAIYVCSNGSANLLAMGFTQGMFVTQSNGTTVTGPYNYIKSVNSTAITLAYATTDSSNVALYFISPETVTSAVGLEPDTYSTNLVNQTVRNEIDYYNKQLDNQWSPEVGVTWVAKYPGALGNSLRVSVVDTVNAFSSNVDLVPSNTLCTALTIANGSVTGSFTITRGSNTVDLILSGDTSGKFANYLHDNILSVGDQILMGNTTINKQFMQISKINTPVTNATASVLNLEFIAPYRLHTDYGSNTFVRNWEFFNAVGTAPGTSNYQLMHGNSDVIDEMHVVVVDDSGLFTGTPGVILETFKGLSRATDAKNPGNETNYYAEVINQNSAYIWWAQDRPGAEANNSLNLINSTNYAPGNYKMKLGFDGLDEASVDLGTIAKGYDMFASKEDITIDIVLQGKPLAGLTVSQGVTVENFLLANYILDNIVEMRKDCVACISPDSSLTLNKFGQEAINLVAWRNAVHESSYGIMDSGYKYQYDKYNDVYRWIPLNGDIGGLIARTDKTNDAWWPPAGFNRGQIKNLVKLAYNPRNTDRDLLYVNNVNPVVSFPGEGTILFGDKTLQTKPSAFDRINVRRLFLVLERAISIAAKYSLFEFNDQFTRSQFKNLVVPYLRTIQGRRGITDFLVVCDDTNNTPQIIDSNQFVGDIYIKPARSINFIQLNFVAVATGVQFSEVVGKF